MKRFLLFSKEKISNLYPCSNFKMENFCFAITVSYKYTNDAVHLRFQIGLLTRHYFLMSRNCILCGQERKASEEELDGGMGRSPVVICASIPLPCCL